MKKLLIIFFAIQIYSQTNFNNFILRVNLINDLSIKSSTIDSFIVANKFPLIENNFAIFIYRGSANSVSVAGDFNGWSAMLNLTNLSGTNLFYLSKNFEANARLDYKFILNGSNWILDPLNPNYCYGGFGPNSELSMLNYIQPWEIINRPNIAHGTIENKTIASINLAATHQLQIYLPPSYSQNNTRKYPTVYFQDGSEYVSLASANLVLDNLIDSLKIEEVIAVFVKPNNRNDEYAGGKRNQYIKFFVDELVPFIENNYRTINQNSKRLVLGASYGGNISALISYNYSNIFGNLGIHSGAFQSNNYEAYNLFISAEKKNIKIVSVWGSYESLFQNMRNFRDILNTKGYNFISRELPEGHSWGLWRANIDLILENIFPYKTTNVKSKSKSQMDFKLYQNYPNPFNNETIINYQLAKSGEVTLKVYDVLGKEIATLADRIVNANEPQQINFNASNLPHQKTGGLTSGIYYYRIAIHSDKLASNNAKGIPLGQTEIKKMILMK
ncbi:MAG: alpha/beta hydrolase-fold protein [Bacteroidota bacterium]